MLSINNIINPQSLEQNSATGISLKLNQLLTAKILEIFPDQTAKILYNGAALHAKLEAPLTKGNHYLFEVGDKNGTVILKKIDVDPLKSTTEQILQKLNLPQTENNKKAAEFVVSEKMPVTKENIKQVAVILQLTANIPFKDRKEVIHRMQELQLPAKPVSVNAVIASIQKNTDQAEMRQLFESLIPYVHKDKSIAKTVDLLQSLYAFKTNHSKPKESSQVSASSANTIHVSKEPSVLPGNSGIEIKGFISETKDEAKTSQINQPAGQRAEASVNDIKRQASNDLLQAVQKWFLKSGLLHERNLLKDPLQVTQTETLKSLIMTLKQNLESLGLPESISLKAEQALNKLSSQQIQNIPANEHLHQFVLQIPLGQNENPREISIRWEGKKQNGQSLDPDHCRMVFWLEMKNLKDIAVDVQIQNRILSLKVFSGHPQIENLSKAFLPSLKKSLSEMNYMLSSITFAQKPKNEIKSPESNTGYKGMDMRI
ncbi:DUF6240 domain-containing protein [Fictibacillus sp. NPDC058756]|uniref:DUF6240 domain-containing protein n=1 Tax=Fictibacillus sp. NPDC058756 TaxID=3346625 RepID=UPI0036BAFA78